MRNTELIIFILVVAINGGIALWKKYSELKARRAAEAMARPTAMSRTPVAAAPARTRGAIAPPKSKSKATPGKPGKPGKPAKQPPKPAKQPPKPAPSVAARRSSPPAPAREPARIDRRPAAAAMAIAAAVASRPAAPVAATAGTWSGVLRGRAGLRRAIVMREVLGPPRALAPWEG